MNSGSKSVRTRRPKWKPQFLQPLFPPERFTVEELDAAVKRLVQERKTKRFRHAATAAN